MTAEFIRSPARALALGLFAATLGACSFLQIGYPNLDTFAASLADDYFDLDLRQKQEFRSRFDRLHAWHRYEQLPDYAHFLSDTKTRIDRGLTRGDVQWVVGGVQERYRTLVRRSVDDAAAVLVTLTPEQIQAVQRQFDKVNRKFVREYQLEATVDEQRRAAARRSLARVRDWTGNLSAEQEKRITAMARELPLIHGLRHEDRMRRQREFIQLLRNREDPKFAQRLRHFLVNWEEGRDPRYEHMFRESTEKHAELYMAVSQMLTPAQRTAVTRKLQGYIDDITRLAQRPATAAQPTASR